MVAQFYLNINLGNNLNSNLALKLLNIIKDIQKSSNHGFDNSRT